MNFKAEIINHIGKYGDGIIYSLLVTDNDDISFECMLYVSNDIDYNFITLPFDFIEKYNIDYDEYRNSSIYKEILNLVSFKYSKEQLLNIDENK